MLTRIRAHQLFFGANVGRNANRIKGARCIIDGVEYNLESNDGDNGNNLHSGSNCTALKMWKAIYDENVNDKISFEILSKDMEQGFPGNLKVNLTYILTEDNELILNYKGTTDKTTIANFTNHSYYNLNGHDSGEVYEQKLMINGDYFTPFATNNSIPSGEIRSVKGTPMDFTEMKSIGRDIDVEDEQLKFGTGYDHNFMINENAHELRLAAKASEISQELRWNFIQIHRDYNFIQLILYQMNQEKMEQCITDDMHFVLNRSMYRIISIMINLSRQF